MTKNATIRTQETIAFIRNAAVPAHANRRDLIADLLERKYPVSPAISAAMSQGRNLAIKDRGTIKTHRHYRRACIAIRASILGQALPAVTNAVAAVADGALPATLAADMNAVFLQENQHLQNQLQALKANPGVFLANNNIYITEDGPSGPRPYIFYYNHDNQTYCFAPVGVNANNIIPLGGFAGNRAVFIQEQIHHVRIQEFTDPAIGSNLGAITGDLIAGTPAASIMLTARFSGCSFMYQHAAANMTAIHINPGGPPHGRFYDLALTLRGVNPAAPPGTPAAAFANANNAGNTHIWGCQQNENRPLDYEPTAYHFVIGVLRGGQWEVWVQKHAPINQRAGHWQLS